MSIEAQSLCFRYGARQALDRVTLLVRSGEVACVLGSNGAGKSTLFKVLCGLLAPSSGSVRIAGFPLPERRKEARRSIGYVAQRFSLYEDLTVEENLQFYAGAYGLDRAAAAARAEELLDRFELISRRRDPAGSLSHGWRQRLAFGAALAHRPSVLLLDEATAGLDTAARLYAWNVIRDEAERGAAVLLSTHDLGEAERCQSTIRLEEGRPA
jgi:ABC-2 type transport system ATP-binding protein